MIEKRQDTDPVPLSAEFSVQQKGAWVDRLQDYRGNIFFPLMTNDAGKPRGGMHVCLPNFGPDIAGKFKQHGFGRDMEWTRTTDEAESQVFTLDCSKGLEPSFEEYAKLKAELRFAATQDSFTTTLTVRNEGSDELPLSPGFHPYFAVREGDEVMLNGKPVVLADYGGTEFVTADTMSLQIGNRKLTLSGGDLRTWAIWTEGDHFICVEPTLDGDSFNSDHPPHIIPPGEMQSFTFTIAW